MKRITSRKLHIEIFLKAFRFKSCLFLVCVLFTKVAIPQGVLKEIVLYNGKIFTAESSTLTADAVSIAGDKIIAVGSLGLVRSTVSNNAQYIDLKGKCLLPGLIDSHNHAISGGESLLTATLHDTFLGKEELRDFAKQTLESKKGMRGDVLYIGGVHSGTWAAVSDLHDLFNKEPYLNQPVILRGSDGHTAWANSIMLQRASINPVFIKSLSAADQKYFGVNQNFEPNGLISEGGIQKLRDVLAASAVDQKVAGETAVTYLNSLGITAWLDPSAGDISEGENNGELAVYRSLSEESKLTAHVAAVVVAKADDDPDSQIAVIKKLQERFKPVTNVSVIGFKVFADGVLEFPTQTAAISMAYSNSGQRGSLMFDPEKFKHFVSSADKEELLVHVHAIGDRAVTETLNAFSYARKKSGDVTRPHSITHLQLVRPNDFIRFSKLNIIPCMQLLWASADVYTMDLVKPYINPSLFAYQYPASSIVKSGASIAGASDWPVSSVNPFEAIHMAETREGKQGILGPKEIMSRIEMLKAYTIHAAKVMWQEKSIGSIAPGKQADFVLVDRDVLTVSPQEIKDTKVLWTMFGGDIIYKQ